VSAAAFAVIAGCAAAGLVFFVLLAVAMLPLSNWPAKTARRGDTEPGKL
jgi:hypothetical protein